MKYEKIVVDMQHMSWEYLKKYEDFGYRDIYYFQPVSDITGVYGPLYTITKNLDLIGKPNSSRFDISEHRFAYQPIDTPTDSDYMWMIRQIYDSGYRSKIMMLPLTLSFNRGFNTFLQKIDPSMEMRFIELALDGLTLTDYNTIMEFLKNRHIVSYAQDFRGNPGDRFNFRDLYFHYNHAIDHEFRHRAYQCVPLIDTEACYVIKADEYDYLECIQQFTIKINDHEVTIPCYNNPQEVLTNCFYLSRYSQAQDWCKKTNTYDITIEFTEGINVQEIGLRGVFDYMSKPISFYNIIMSMYNSITFDGENYSSIISRE